MKKRLFYNGYIIKSLFKPSARIIVVQHIKVEQYINQTHNIVSKRSQITSTQKTKVNYEKLLRNLPHRALLSSWLMEKCQCHASTSFWWKHDSLESLMLVRWPHSRQMGLLICFFFFYISNPSFHRLRFHIKSSSPSSSAHLHQRHTATKMRRNMFFVIPLCIVI